jgi:hypothetical protein
MSQPADNADAADPRQQADDRLVHALLLHVHDEQSAQRRQRRVQRAMDAIRESSRPQGDAAVPPGARGGRVLRFPAWSRRVAWAAAAMVLIGLGVWVVTLSPSPAMASLDDVLGALGRPGDRVYHISMEDLPQPPGRTPPQENHQPAAPRPGLDDARLYLRDGRQYLLVRHDPAGGLIYDGYDGRQSWRARDGVLAEVKEGPGAGGIPMPPMMADVPLSDLPQTVQRIRMDYTVGQFDTAALPGRGPPLRHVLVRRNSRQVKGPETIEIWADPATGMPRRIVFDNAKVQGSSVPCRLTFDLVSQQPLPGDWFSTDSPALKGDNVRQ